MISLPKFPEKQWGKEWFPSLYSLQHNSAALNRSTIESPEHNMENVALLNLNLTFKQYQGMLAFPLYSASSGNSFIENIQGNNPFLCCLPNFSCSITLHRRPAPWHFCSFKVENWCLQLRAGETEVVAPWKASSMQKRVCGPRSPVLSSLAVYGEWKD